MGKNYSAMTWVQVAALVEARAKVEIEVTAELSDRGRARVVNCHVSCASFLLSPA